MKLNGSYKTEPEAIHAKLPLMMHNCLSSGRLVFYTILQMKMTAIFIHLLSMYVVASADPGTEIRTREQENH